MAVYNTEIAPGTAAIGFSSDHVLDGPVALRPDAALRLEPGLDLHQVPPTAKAIYVISKTRSVCLAASAHTQAR